MKEETLEEAAKDTTNKYINEREKQTAYLEFIEGAKWQQETLDKKSLYIQDYKSRISALQYVIDFYEILTKEDIVKQKDDYSKQLKDLENE
jgi:hypothetical protein